MTQKELKAIYREELKKAWKDEKMVDFCASKAAFVIEHDGGLYSIDNPSIQKDFCFGYGMYLQATDEEMKDAERCAEIVRTSEENFIERNMKYLNRTIERLQKIADDMMLNWAEGSHPVYMIDCNEHYYSQTSDCKLRLWSVVNTFCRTADSELCNDIEFVQKLVDGHIAVKADFEKRLKAYTKRYGLSKVNSWAYLVD